MSPENLDAVDSRLIEAPKGHPPRVRTTEKLIFPPSFQLYLMKGTFRLCASVERNKQKESLLFEEIA